MGPDAHQFVTTARNRAVKTLADTGVGRICTLNERTGTVTITFDYPAEFKHLVTPSDIAGFRAAGLTSRAVVFSTSPHPEGPLGRVVFSRDGQRAIDVLIKPELGADALAAHVVAFITRDTAPAFPPTMVVTE
jgi:hypothetical protein